MSGKIWNRKEITWLFDEWEIYICSTLEQYVCVTKETYFIGSVGWPVRRTSQYYTGSPLNDDIVTIYKVYQDRNDCDPCGPATHANSSNVSIKIIQSAQNGDKLQLKVRWRPRLSGPRRGGSHDFPRPLIGWRGNPPRSPDLSAPSLRFVRKFFSWIGAAHAYEDRINLTD